MTHGHAAVGASEALRARASAGAKRWGLWALVVGLPLAYEFSGRLPGLRAYDGGSPAYWFAGLQVQFVLLAVAAAVVALVLLRGREGLASVGWPARMTPWHIAVGLAGVLGAVALAVYFQPAAVSTQIYGVTASTPVDVTERVALVVLALVAALVEETVWRGAIIAWLRPNLGLFAAAALSALSYAFYHPGLAWQWNVMFLQLLMAAVYTLLAVWRKNIGPAVFLHFLLVAGQLLAPVAR